MNATNMPGFTAEESLRTKKGHYQTVARQGYASAGDGVVLQMGAASLGRAGGPFSGSCGCGPGYCCCILCYFNNCYFWCWSTVFLSPF
jgi:hypothetical protein